MSKQNDQKFPQASHDSVSLVKVKVKVEQLLYVGMHVDIRLSTSELCLLQCNLLDVDSVIVLASALPSSTEMAVCHFIVV